jgi:hypothetical protein
MCSTGWPYRVRPREEVAILHSSKGYFLPWPPLYPQSPPTLNPLIKVAPDQTDLIGRAHCRQPSPAHIAAAGPAASHMQMYHRTTQQPPSSRQKPSALGRHCLHSRRSLPPPWAGVHTSHVTTRDLTLPPATAPDDGVLYSFNGDGWRQHGSRQPLKTPLRQPVGRRGAITSSPPASPNLIATPTSVI